MARLPHLILGAILAAAALGIVLLGDLTHAIGRFLALFGAMFVVYALAVAFAGRLQWRRHARIVFVVAVVVRVIFCAAQPSLSTDIYRYLWEGRVIRAGANPFATPPDAPQLEHLRDDNYEHINHPQLATIYPPVAQAVFFVGAVMWPSLTMQKILFVAFDLATLVLIFLLLRSRGRDPGYAIVYAWSPLVALEFAHSGHMDAIGIFFLVLAIFMVDKRRPLAAAAAIALSVLAKFLALVLLPFWAMKRKHLWGIAVVGALVVVGYLPFASAGVRLFASLKEYGTYWYFNSVAFTLLAGLIANSDAIRIGLLALTGAFVLYQARRQADVVRYVFLVIGFALLMTPTVYPWYITWIVPFLCFYRSLGWIAFTGLVVASYSVWPGYYESGEWVAGGGLLAFEYLPFFALLIVDVWRRRRAREVTA